jgi:hypothetical protein
MSYRTLAFSALSSLVLLAGACKSTLEPTGLGTVAGDTVTNPTGDDRGLGGQGADDPAGDDRGGLTGGNGADDPAGDDHGGGQGGPGWGGADDPANHD